MTTSYRDRWLAAAAALLGWGFGIGALAWALLLVTAKTRHYSRAHAASVTPPPLSQLPTPLLDLATFGYRSLYDDFADLWLIQTLGDEHLATLDGDQVFAALTAVTGHHPRFESLYMLGCFAMSNDFRRPAACRPLLDDGMAALPGSWRLPMTRGFVEAFQLNDNAQAALYYAVAAARPASPAYLASLADKLRQKDSLSIPELEATKDDLFKTLGLPRLTDHAGRPLREGKP